MNLKNCIIIITVQIFLASIDLTAAHISGDYLKCVKFHKEITTTKSRQDLNHYRIEIEGDPDYYTPGEQYTISLQSAESRHGLHNFARFVLYVEVSNDTESVNGKPGTLLVLGDSTTSISEGCPNLVFGSDKKPKNEVKVSWMSPNTQGGCVVFRTRIEETDGTWLGDYESPFLRICEESRSSDENPLPVQKQCCACDEAKYEVTFEGLWTRNTHPKDFPSNG